MPLDKSTAVVPSNDTSALLLFLNVIAFFVLFAVSAVVAAKALLAVPAVTA